MRWSVRTDFRLTLSWRGPLPYRNQDWFLYDSGLRHERVNPKNLLNFSINLCKKGKKNIYKFGLIFFLLFILWINENKFPQNIQILSLR